MSDSKQKISVAGQLWNLVTFKSASRSDGAMGRCDSKMGAIHICEDLPESVRDATLVHEWLHGILDAYGVDHNEMLVGVLGVELYRCGFRVPVQSALGEKE